jgi:hypothetical protein
MAAHASAKQPKGSDDVGAGDEARRRLAPATARPPPLAEPTFRRQAPEVGAGCGNAARPDLCRGALSNGRPYRDYKIHKLLWVLPRESRALLSRFPADAALGRTVRGRQDGFRFGGAPMS